MELSYTIESRKTLWEDKAEEKGEGKNGILQPTKLECLSSNSYLI